MTAGSRLSFFTVNVNVTVPPVTTLVGPAGFVTVNAELEDARRQQAEALAQISALEAQLAEFAGVGFGTFKPRLADLAVAKLGPVGEAMRRYMSDPAEIDRILAAGAARAREVAAPTLAEVKSIVGYWAG